MKGKAIIFSAPSGAGKTTIVQRLLTEIPELKFSISATTRSQRANEIPGKDYYFLDLEDFQTKAKSGAFLEWEEVYENTFYGTLRSEVDRIWSNGDHVIFDVDVKGGIRLKDAIGEEALSIFIKVPSVEILRDRLTKRNTEDATSLKRRIAKATQEMSEEGNFDEVIVNDDLDDAIESARRLIREFIDS